MSQNIFIPDHLPRDCADLRAKHLYGEKVTAGTLKACRVNGPNGPIPFHKLFTLELKEGEELPTETIEVDRDDTIGVHSVGPTLFVRKGGATGEDIQLDQRTFFGCGPPPKPPVHTPIKDQIYLELNTGRAYQYDGTQWNSIDDCCIRVSENTAIVSEVLESDGCLIFGSVSDALAAGRNQIAIRDGNHVEPAVLNGGGNTSIYIEIMQFASLQARFLDFEVVTLEGQGTFIGTPTETPDYVFASSSPGVTRVRIADLTVQECITADRSLLEVHSILGNANFTVTRPVTAATSDKTVFRDSVLGQLVIDARLSVNRHRAVVDGNRVDGSVNLFFEDFDDADTYVSNNRMTDFLLEYDTPNFRGIRFQDNTVSKSARMRSLVENNSSGWKKSIVTGNKVDASIQLTGFVNSGDSSVDGTIIEECVLANNVCSNIIVFSRFVRDVQIENNNAAIDVLAWFVESVQVDSNKIEGDLKIMSFPIDDSGETQVYKGNTRKSIISNNSVNGGSIQLYNTVQDTVIEGNRVQAPDAGQDALTITTFEKLLPAASVTPSNTVISGNVFDVGDIRIGRFSEMVISSNNLDCSTGRILFDTYSPRFHIITGNRARSIEVDNFAAGAEAVNSIVTSCITGVAIDVSHFPGPSNVVANNALCAGEIA